MTTATQDNLTQVEEMLRMAANAGEPGTLMKGTTIPDNKGQLALGVTELKSAGYVWIYDTLTGEPSKINRNMLPSKLKQTRPDGSYLFSVRQTVQPARGTFKCMLHPDTLDRVYYDTMGLAVCRKNNLTSPFQVERHMQKRHKVEWETIKNEKDRKEKQEDRELQRQMIEGMTGAKQPEKPKVEETPLEMVNAPENRIVEAQGVSIVLPKRKYKKHKHRAKKEV